jgi:hypothetical protein
MTVYLAIQINDKGTDRMSVELTSTDEPKNQGERRLKIVSVRSEASFDDFSLSPACFSRLAGALRQAQWAQS